MRSDPTSSKADLLSRPLNKTRDRDRDQDLGHQVSRLRPSPRESKVYVRKRPTTEVAIRRPVLCRPIVSCPVTCSYTFEVSAAPWSHNRNWQFVEVIASE